MSETMAEKGGHGGEGWCLRARCRREQFSILFLSCDRRLSGLLRLKLLTYRSRWDIALAAVFWEAAAAVGLATQGIFDNNVMVSEDVRICQGCC